MPLILFHELKANLTKPTIIEVDEGVNLMDCIEKHFPMGFGCNVEMHWDAVGEIPFFKSDTSDRVSLEIPIEDNLHIVCRPQGIETLLYVAVAAVAAAVVVATSIKTPPNDTGNVKQSPNNQLKAQSNIARTGEAMPYIVGRVRSYPDLISEPVLEFVDNNLEITEQFLIGIGSYELTNFKSADSLLSTLDGASANSYQPGEWPDEQPLEAFSADNINGQTLLGINESDTVVDSATTLAGEMLSFEGDEISFRVPYDAAWAVMQSKDLPYSARVTYQRNIVELSGGNEVDVLSEAVGSGFVTSAVINEDPIGTPSTIDFFVDQFTGPTAQPPVNQSNPSYGTNITLEEKEARAVGPFPTNAISDQLWFNFAFEKGLNAAVDIRIETEQINSDGDVIPGTSESFDFSYSDDTFDAQYRTRKITPSGGLARYQFTLTRIDNTSENLEQPDEVKIQRVQSVRSSAVTTYGNVTWAIIKTRASNELSSQSERNFNVIANRKTQSYSNGSIVEDLSATRNGADSVLQVFIDAGRNAEQEVNLDELYDIYSNIGDSRLGFCDFTFDDEDISLRQRIDLICDASRVVAYRAGQTWEFDRDEKKDFVSFSFNRRNMSASRNQGQTWRGQLPKTPNSIEVKWRDIDGDNKDKFIYLLINQNEERIDIVSDIGFNRPKRLSVSGVTNEFQAMNRAQLEARKLIYERVSVKDTILSDAYNVGIGQIGYWADVYERTINDGEILGYNNGLVDSSERIILDATATNYVTITNELGEPEGRVIATARSDTEFGFTATLDGVILADLSSVQLGSRYILSTESNLDKSLFRMLGKSPKEGNEGQLLVDVEMIQYDERVYEYDEVQ